MISLAMRIVLVAGSLFTTFFILRRIRRSQLQIRDCLFWVFFAVVLLLLSIFPRTAIWAAERLGVESPVNFVYLIIIFLLLLQQFSSALRLSQLDAKVKTLTQKLALYEALPATQTSPPEDKP